MLLNPDGEAVLEAEAARAHRLVELFDLYAEGKVSLATPDGSLTFKRNRAAVADVRAFLEQGLASDVEYRTQLRREAAGAIPRGLVMFVVAGSLFGLYCWWASRRQPAAGPLGPLVRLADRRRLAPAAGHGPGRCVGLLPGGAAVAAIRRIERALDGDPQAADSSGPMG